MRHGPRWGLACAMLAFASNPRKTHRSRQMHHASKTSASASSMILQCSIKLEVECASDWRGQRNCLYGVYGSRLETRDV